MLESERCVAQPGRYNALPAEQQRRPFPQCEFQQQGRGNQPCRAMECGGKRLGELAVAHREGGGHVVRAAHRLVIQHLQNNGGVIVDVYPAHPLLSGADAETQPHLERQHETVEHASLVAQHQSGAQRAQAHAEGLHFVGGSFPCLAERGRKVAAGRCAFRQHEVAAISVIADGRAAQHHLRFLPGGRDMADQLAGQGHPAIP